MKKQIVVDKCRVNIAIVEPSCIIYEGLSNLLLKDEKHFNVFNINDYEEFKNLISKENFNIVIINPSLIQNNLKEFKKLKNSNTEVSWIGLIYSFFNNDLLLLFDDTFIITDPPQLIIQRITKFVNNCHCNNTSQQEQLSERETEVLIQLIKGFSNKEIADKLNISIHTVVSHRKNITQKTGIKSQSGLTIYAITKKIISFDSILTNYDIDTNNSL